MTEGKAIDGIMKVIAVFDKNKKKHIISYILDAVEKDLEPKTKLDINKVTLPEFKPKQSRLT